MTPDEIATKFPRLFHVTRASAVDGIRRHGLLSVRAALDLFEVDHERADRLKSDPRLRETPIDHPVHGEIVLSDNTPITKKALAKCLDDGIKPEEWMRILAGKVFFWRSEKQSMKLSGSSLNKSREHRVIVFDTAPLVEAHFDTVAFSPINSGNTRRLPARRGHSTFARMKDRTYHDWSRMREKKSHDTVEEVTIDYAVPNADRFILDVL